MKKIDNLVKLAHKFWRDGNEIEMSKVLEEAIIICRENNDIQKLIELLNDYGGCLRMMGNFDKAVDCIKEAISLIEFNFSKNSISYATSVMNLANIYREKKDYYNAEKYFLESKKIFEFLYDKSYSYIGLLNNMSLLYQEIEQYEQANDLQLQAIELLKYNEKYKVPLAISYNNLYEIQKKLNTQKDGLKYLLKAKKILSKEVSNDHPLNAAVSNNLGDYNFYIKNYEEALQAYKEALRVTKSCYGENSSAYKAVASNCAYVEDFLYTVKKKDKVLIDKNNRISGLDRARELSYNVKKYIDTNYPILSNKICIALVGLGSECLGYDDIISEDHDFDLRCQLFLTDDDYNKYSNDLNKSFQNDINGKVIIQTIKGFYKYFTLFEEGPVTNKEYRKVPQDLLRTATNGEVFYDTLGEFSSIRNRLLQFYPDDIVYKKMAYHLNKMAQSGQYNYNRCLKRNDIVAANQSIAIFIKNYIAFIHLINKEYMPFYKWAFKSCTQLKILGEYSKNKLEELVLSNIDKKHKIIQELCSKIIEFLNENNLSNSKIDFLTYQANEVTKNIQDETLRTEDNWIE